MTADQEQALLDAAERAGITPRVAPTPRDRMGVVNGIRLHWLEWGDPDLPAIVFLHGGNLTAHTWDLVCLSLADRYHCLAVDLRGHGDSEWPADADYRIASYSDDVRAFLSELKAPAVLVGMSLGGLAALITAAGTELAGLVLVDIGPEPRREGTKDIRAFARSSAEPAPFEDYVQRSVRFNPLRQPELLRRSLLHNLRRLPDGLWVWKWDPRRITEARLDRASETPGLWAAAAAVTVPALVLRGAKSTVFLDEDAERLVEVIPTARSLTVADAGHSIQGDNPAGFVAAIEPFLAEVAPSP
jgi:pimeloyl-ACP methyl ester carboxylesterase